MKKKCLFLLFTCLFLLQSCGEKRIYLDRPEDTNLVYWITEKETQEKSVQCTLYQPGFGCSTFLDGRYDLIQKEEGWELPEHYVLYFFAGYPNCENTQTVLNITITDPGIHFYGLSLNSDSSSIQEAMTQQSFSNQNQDNPNRFTKANILFRFETDRIEIRASANPECHVDF